MDAGSSVRWCLALSLAYVGCLYVLPSSIRSLPRSHPTHIQWRMVVVTAVTGLLGLLSAHVLHTAGQHDAWQLFGFRAETAASSIAVSMALICTLFLGPLAVASYETYLATKAFAEGAGLSQWHALWKYCRSTVIDRAMHERWVTMRNLVTGPVTEEIVFRGYMLALLLVGGVHPTTACFAAPIFFGAAHLHHAVELLRMGYTLPNVLVSTLFQMLYTSVFGSIAAFMFICTKNVAGPIAAHMFCNWMGLPDLSFLSAPGKSAPSGEVLVHEKRILFLVLYVLGVIGFVYGMQELVSKHLPVLVTA